MKVLSLWLLLQLCAAIVPLISQSGAPRKVTVPFAGWPTTYAGNPLERIPLKETEERFSRDFSGKLAKFTDGNKEILVRWLDTPSRSLHPAADCLKGSGYTVKPGPLMVDREGVRWGCVTAKRKSKQLKVCERIFDEHGNTWTDTSSWFWSAILGKTTGPWWAITVAGEEGSGVG